MAKKIRYSNCDLIDSVVKRLIKHEGWAMMRRHGGHPVIRSADSGAMLVVPTTPSDCRASKNWLAQARRLGVTT